MSFARLLLCLLGPLLCFPLRAAERVISLAPHTTELAYAAGLGPKMIAVSAYSDYPAQASQLEQVASWQGINVERILALKPDLILAWRGGNPQRILDQLARQGIALFYSDPQTVDAIADDLQRLASYSPTPAKAKQAATHLRAQIAALRQAHPYSATPSVLLQFGTHPLFVAADNTLQHDLLTLCGARNVFADSAVAWPQVSREQVIRRHPQVVVIAGDQQQAQTVKAFWQPQLYLPVIALPPDWFSRGGPRAILAAQQLCSQLDKREYSAK